jgi:hypothetical protein
LQEHINKTKASFDQVFAHARDSRRRADIEQRILSSVKLWLETFPEDSHLEQIKPTFTDLRKQALVHKSRQRAERRGEVCQ